MRMTARQVLFSGRVQGVGFRYTAKQIAAGFDVTGWIRNLDDGRVEMHVMAAEDQEIESFLDEIRQSHLGSLLKAVEIHCLPPLAGARGFVIVR